MLYGKSLCETGSIREINQDRAALFIDGETALGFVADGIGGHYSGEIASETIYTAICEWWRQYHTAALCWPPQKLSEQFKALLNGCAEELHKITPQGVYCGSTVVLLWVAQPHYLLLSAGDSRCYCVKPQQAEAELRQLSSDDVYHASGAGDGHLDGKLTNAIGSDYVPQYSIQTGKIKGDTLFALCSDGIYKYCAANELEHRLTAAGKDGDLTAALKDISNVVISNGAPDNYSLVLLQCK